MKDKNMCYCGMEKDYVRKENTPMTTQRDADKGGCCESCTTIMHKGKIERTLACLDPECPCHSPKPQANVGDSWEEEFLTKFGDNYLVIKNGVHKFSAGQYDAVKNFIRSLLSTTSAQKLESLEREVEGLKHELPTKPCMNLEMHTFGSCFQCEKSKGFNSAITAVLDIIRKQK